MKADRLGVQSGFDYVVVGSGAGGGPLAANLAEAGMRVLLLEAGGDHGGYTYQVPGFHGNATEDEQLRWDYFVRHYADDEKQKRDSKYVSERDGVFYPRSGTLGGCTAHNAMITVSPHASDWDRIAELTGDRSWTVDKMHRYFERLEACQYLPRPRMLPRNRLLRALLTRLPVVAGRFFNPARHGFDGWLTTNLADPKLALGDAKLVKVLLAAAEEALTHVLNRPLRLLEGLNTAFDPNDWRVRAVRQGVWFTPMSTSGGSRVGSRERIGAVEASHPDRLVVRPNALAVRVLFDLDRAVGVEYINKARAYRADPRAVAEIPPARVKQVFAAREVILCAGAFNTPQLLKLSGIGPREELERHGIPVRVDSPGVGENLQDRYEVGVVWEMNTDFSVLTGATFTVPGPGEEPDAAMRQWREGKGVYTTNGVVVGITRPSKSDGREPDLYIFGLPASFKGYYPGYSKALARSKNYFTWAILKAHTSNTAGRVTLRSADPRDPPDINFHYFEEGNDPSGDDLESVVAGVEFVRDLMASTGSITKQEVVPGTKVASRHDIREFVRDEAWGHHASCSARIGADGDRMAVLDGDFRVRGTRGLRVVDASVFPAIPGYFIVSAVYMIAEKASEVILDDARREEPLIRRVLRKPASVVPRDGSGDGHVQLQPLRKKVGMR